MFRYPLWEAPPGVGEGVGTPEFGSLFHVVRGNAAYKTSILSDHRSATLFAAPELGGRPFLGKESVVLTVHYKVTGAVAVSAGKHSLSWTVHRSPWSDAERLELTLAGPAGIPLGARTAQLEQDGRPPVVLALTPSGEGLVARSPEPVGPGTRLRVTAEWLVTPTGAMENFLRTEILGLWVLAIPGAVWLFFLVWWSRSGRDPDERAIPVRYDPPRELTAAEAATVLRNSAWGPTALCVFLSLAEKGWIRLEETAGGFRIVLLRPRSEAATLPAQESWYLAASFPDRGAEAGAEAVHVRSVGELLAAAIFDDLRAKGAYRIRPDLARWRALGLGCLVSLVGPFLLVPAILIARFGFDWPLSPYGTAGAFAAFLPLVALARYMPARTRRGADLYEAVVGFRKFVSMVHTDPGGAGREARARFLSVLPYAFAMDLADEWVAAHENAGAMEVSWIGPSNRRLRPTEVVAFVRRGFPWLTANPDPNAKPLSIDFRRYGLRYRP